MKRKQHRILSRLCFIFMLIGLLTLPLNAWAVHSSSVLYSESNLGGGLWKYDYTITNDSDPFVDAGYNIYDLFLSFESPLILTNILSPAGWDQISDASSFIDWFSATPGEPPSGTDIPPATSLSGFSFVSNTRLASIPFDVLLSNPDDPMNPVPFSGTTTSSVPLPPAIYHLIAGIIGVLYLRKRLK